LRHGYPTTRSPSITTAEPSFRSAMAAATAASGAWEPTTNTSRVMASSTGTSDGSTPGRVSINMRSRWLTMPTSAPAASTGRCRTRWPRIRAWASVSVRSAPMVNGARVM
jgi:hypothetical protein